MKFVTLIIFFVCLNLAATFLTVSGAFASPVSPRGYTTNFAGVFVIPQLNWQTVATLGTGGVVAFLSGALLGNVYAGMLVGIVWVFSCFLTPLAWLVNQFPYFAYDIVMSLAQNNATYEVVALSIQSLMSGVFVFVGFMFVMELFSQRYMT